MKAVATERNPEKANTPTLAISERDRLVHVKEAAQLLRISEVSIRRYLTKKILTRYKVGARTVMKLSDVLALVRQA
jgi:hypothetical protein